MRNFDETRLARRSDVAARTFVLGGERFVLRAAVRPEVLMQMDRVRDPEVGGQETLEAIDHFVLDVVEPEPDTRKRWARVREREGDDAVDLQDLVDLVEWMAGAMTGRPPTPPSDSSNGSPMPASTTLSTPGTQPAASTSQASIPLADS